jgi:tricorn protease
MGLEENDKVSPANAQRRKAEAEFSFASLRFAGENALALPFKPAIFWRTRRMFNRISLGVVLFFCFLVLSTKTGAQNGHGGQTRLLRTPTVSATQIGFAYANNIWVVPRAGGSARRLTSFQGQTANPHFSPDGRWIAFSGEYAGNFDVYLVSAEGGEPKRLTWHPGADLVEGWTPDGKSILFSSNRATWAPSGAPRFWTVSTEGGVEEPMALPRAYQGKISADGTRIAYRMNNSWDEERRNYRGGQNRPIWIVDLKSYDLVSPPWTDSKDVYPVWVDDSVLFISDRDGVANVWEYQTKSKKLAQITKFTDFDVKSMDSGAGTVVFEQAGYVHELDPKSGKTKIVSIVAAGDFPWMMPNWEDVTNRLSNMALSPTGKRVVVEARGEVFTIPADKGDVRNLTNSSSSAERDPAWSPDGKFVSYFSDKSGEYKLVIEAQDGLTPPREITIAKPTHYYTPSWSPDSKKLLFTDTNLKVWVLDLATEQAKIVGQDPWMVPARTLNPAWSPDSKWVAYSSRLRSLYHAIFVSNVESGESKQITDGLADAVWPAWDASGKYLWFLASTDFGLRSQWLDMTSYDHETNFGLYFAVLRKTDPSPLLPESDEDRGVGTGTRRPQPGACAGDAGPAEGGGGEGGQRGPRPPVTVQIDFDGLQQRIVSVPGVPERQYADLQTGIDGQLFYLEAGRASAGQGGPGGGGSNELMRYRLCDRRASTFVAGVAAYEISADRRKLVYRAAGGGGGQGGGPGGGGTPQAPQLFLVDADRTPPQPGSGRLNFALRMYLEPKEEFKQIFNEGWRNQRDYLYVPNMHGADWPRMREMYGQLLPYAMHRADLNYLMDMMGAEIAIGHSYVRGGDMPTVPQPVAGLLGADFAIDNGRYKVTRIYDNESWNPDLRSPLATPGANVNTGDYILAINGIELRAPDNIYRLLDGTANRQTTLTVNTTPSMEGARTVTVIPVVSEQALRTRAWVESNRRLVEKLSDAQLAYVYLPNTGQPGYTSFNRYYFSQQDKKGVVVDERFNGGGSAADYIIDVLQRDFDGYFNNVAGDRYPFTSPSAGIWGPKVMIINEMAGSGGDLMPYMFKRRKIGPLIGKRTWGGLVHTADTPTFIDGGSMIAPRGGFFTRDGKWAVENEGVAPDIDIENWPREVVAGKDPQLERAVQEAMRMLKERPVERSPKEPPPPVWGKRPGE